jgi:cation diffusion facilitator family transporter
MAENAPKTVVVAVGADLLVALAKGVVAAIGGSAAMAAEAVHSFVDAINQALLIIGNRRAARPADKSHPFGHGAEVYFWAIVVAGVIFALGGAATIGEGVYRFVHPQPPTHVILSYAVLAIAFLADGAALTIGVRELRRTYPNRALYKAIRASKDPNVFVVVLEDGAALVGIFLATAGTVLSQISNDGRPDAAASIGIGILLGVVAIAMMTEIASLLTGESIDPEVVESIKAVVREEPGVAEVRRVQTMTLGPKNVIVALHLVFDADRSLADATAAVDRIRDALKQRHQVIGEIFVQVDALAPPEAPNCVA